MSTTHSQDVRSRVRTLVSGGESVRSAAENVGIPPTTAYSMVRDIVPQERIRDRGPKAETAERINLLKTQLEEGLSRKQIMEDLGWSASVYASTHASARQHGIVLPRCQAGRPRLNT